MKVAQASDIQNIGAEAQALALRHQRHDLARPAQGLLGPCPANLEEYWLDIPLHDGWHSRTYVVRPKPEKIDTYLDSPRITTSKTCQIRPMIIQFNGSESVTGGSPQLSLPAPLFAERFNATVFCPAYRLAPEHPWPQPMEDGLELVKLISSNQAYYYGSDPAHGLTLCGVSAGATIAAVVAGLTSSNPVVYPLLNPLTSVFLAAPLLLVESMIPSEYKPVWKSRHENSNAKCQNTAAVESILAALQCTEYTSPYFSPANLSTAQLAEHPPTCLYACDLEPLRDDAIVYEQMLARAGVETKLYIFKADKYAASTKLDLIMPTESWHPGTQQGILEGMSWLMEQALSTVP